jgi:hypothetical protein
VAQAVGTAQPTPLHTPSPTPSGLHGATQAAATVDWAPLILLGLVVLIALGYVYSLWAHPYVRCGTCKGTGRHSGAFFTSSSRPCSACGGSGRQLRLLSRMLPGTNRAQPR